MAEWLGRALQKLPQRFESARDLKNIYYSSVVIGFTPNFTPIIVRLGILFTLLKQSIICWLKLLILGRTLLPVKRHRKKECYPIKALSPLFFLILSIRIIPYEKRLHPLCDDVAIVQSIY